MHGKFTKVAGRDALPVRALERFFYGCSFSSFAYLFSRFDAGLRGHAAVLKPVRLISGFNDMAVMRQPVLTAHESEVRPHFGEESLNIGDQGGFEFSLHVLRRVRGNRRCSDL